MAIAAARGPSVRALGVPLPPAPMPLWRHGRPLKRWSYLGVYTPDLMLCVGDARIGPVPRRWWAVVEPDGSLRGRSSTRAAGVELAERHVRVAAGGILVDLRLGESEAVETASPVGERNYAWTSKRAGFRVSGAVAVDGVRHQVDGPYGFSDESAGYHPRHTAWRWSAGLGRAEDGRHVGWNLVSGIHDGPRASERTLWIDGEPRELGPAAFDPDLSALTSADGADLRFRPWGERRERLNLLLVRSSYRQPFGAFEGSLPGGVRLDAAFGVMEDHDVWW